MGGAERDLTDQVTLEHSVTSKVGPCAELLTGSEGQTTGAGELQQTSLPRAPREMLKASEKASIEHREFRASRAQARIRERKRGSRIQAAGHQIASPRRNWRNAAGLDEAPEF